MEFQSVCDLEKGSSPPNSSSNETNTLVSETLTKQIPKSTHEMSTCLELSGQRSTDLPIIVTQANNTKVSESPAKHNLHNTCTSDLFTTLEFSQKCNSSLNSIAAFSKVKNTVLPVINICSSQNPDQVLSGLPGKNSALSQYKTDTILSGKSAVHSAQRLHQKTSTSTESPLPINCCPSNTLPGKNDVNKVEKENTPTQLEIPTVNLSLGIPGNICKTKISLISIKPEPIGEAVGGYYCYNADVVDVLYDSASKINYSDKPTSLTSHKCYQLIIQDSDVSSSISHHYPAIQPTNVSHNNPVLQKNAGSGHHVLGLKLKDCYKPFQCSVCHKRVCSKGNLTRHLKEIHFNEKPFKCMICNQTFVSKCRLEKHKVTHSTEKQFNCNLCDAAFTYKGSLDKHRAEHANATVRPYKCAHCSVGFESEKGLGCHYRLTHGELPYHCRVCERKFAHLKSFKRHQLKHEKISVCTAVKQSLPVPLG